jgi:hypothetical protein
VVEIFVIVVAAIFGLGCLVLLAAAGYTLIVLAAGASLGGFAVLVICITLSDKRQAREDQRRAMDRQWMLELLKAARSSPSDQSPNEMMTIEQLKPRRIAKR